MFRYTVDDLVGILSRHAKLPPGPVDFYVALISTNPEFRREMEEKAVALEHECDGQYCLDGHTEPKSFWDKEDV